MRAFIKMRDEAEAFLGRHISKQPTKGNYFFILLFGILRVNHAALGQISPPVFFGLCFLVLRSDLKNRWTFPFTLIGINTTK